MSNLIILKPRLSEKAYGLSEQRNTYVFEVASGVNSLSVGAAVAEQYKVGVKKVRITAAPAKTKSSYQRGGRVVHRTKRAGFRKAYVTLKEGETLPIFASVEDNAAVPELKKEKK